MIESVWDFPLIMWKVILKEQSSEFSVFSYDLTSLHKLCILDLKEGGLLLKYKINQKLYEKVQESIRAVVPITLIVLFIATFLIPMDLSTIALFFVGAILLVIGMGFFQLGVEMSMMPLGEKVAGSIFKSRNIPLIFIVFFLMGFLITIAEPDLQVLANQVASIPNEILIYSVALGVGIFLIVGVARFLFHIRLSMILLVLYGLLFLLVGFAPDDFVSVAFDAGGVTTGPMTVPFIMALGMGLSSSIQGKEEDGFGLIALGSIGPILVVMLLGIFFHPGEAVYESIEVIQVTTFKDVIDLFAYEMPHYLLEVLKSISPLLALFFGYQLLTRSFHRHDFLKVLMGFVYTTLGLAFFLCGVNVGFAPVGNLIGSELAKNVSPFLLILVGIVIGYSIVRAEPAVQVLNNQIEEMTHGLISRSAISLTLSIGVSLAVGLSMLRVVTSLSIYWVVIPGYLVALILTFFVPDLFVGIAFDSGGVASGAMTSTFLLPLAMGASLSLGGNVVQDAFGVVALVALSPLLGIQFMGLIYKIKLKRASNKKQIEQEETWESSKLA